MVVCRCRKATKLYCFVHKAPVCGECVSFQEHHLCVVKTYSEWVIDGDYDWPPKCGLCQQVLQETDDTTRLGCFHILHSHCLEAHLRSFPPHTAPAGYVCPSCSTPIWPPKLVKDGSSGLHTKLKQIIIQSDVATTLLGSDSNLVSGLKAPAPPAFSNPPLVSVGNSSAAEESGPTTAGAAGTSSEADGLIGGYPVPSSEIVKESILASASKSISQGEASSSSGAGSSSNPAAASCIQHLNKAGPVSTQQMLPNGAMARKNSIRGDNLSPSAPMGYDEDHEDRKYTRRGPFHRQVMRTLLPFWSPSLPTLPVTQKDARGAPAAEELIDGGRRGRKQRNSSSIDSRKLLLWFAIMSCMATALLLYYRLAQTLGNSTNDDLLQGEEQ